MNCILSIVVLFQVPRGRQNSQDRGTVSIEKVLETTFEDPFAMRPSYSPRRITISKSGQRVYDLESKNISIASKVGHSVQSVLYGLVIAIVMVPCAFGDTRIIYNDPIFLEFMPQLTKLLIISSIVHQFCILMFSKLKFAIGQVQDAGLIFLSTMATSIVHKLGPSVPVEERVTTVMVHLALSTMLVGVALKLTGKLKLANAVHYLPMPVVGGYLGFIGLFTFQAGLVLMTKLQLTGVNSWYLIFEDVQYVYLALPGLIAGVVLLLVTSRYSHFAVLPSMLIAIPTLFYVWLYFSGMTMESARNQGWVNPLSEPIEFYKSWEMITFDRVHWTVMLTQIPTWIGMFLVIAFASSLDIAAIIMGTGSHLDYNEQLQVLGLSNIASGLAGGYTGSYIFSQTLFAYRTNTNSKLVGLSLMFFEGLVVVLPISIISYMPLYFFGSVMIFVGIDLMLTWLVHVYFKVLFREYVVLMLSFISINCFGPQGGILVGVGFAACSFIQEYSSVPVVTQVSKSSNVIRNTKQHDLLAPQHDTIVTMEIHGHIFFGSAIRILNKVKQVVRIRKTFTLPSNAKGSKERLPILFWRKENSDASVAEYEGYSTLGGTPIAKSYGSMNMNFATKFLVFDFKGVSGMDATAARSCFLTLKLLLKEHNICPVYTGMIKDVKFLLETSDVLTDFDGIVYKTLDEGLEYCENSLILNARGSRSFSPTTSVDRLQRKDDLIHIFSNILPSTSRKSFGSLLHYFTLQQHQKGDTIFAFGEAPTSIFVIMNGEVTISTQNNSDRALHQSTELLRRVYSGCIFGDLDYYLDQPRTIQAVVSSSSGAVIYSINRQDVERLQRTEPQVGILFQQAILKTSYLSTSDVLPSLVV